MMKKLRYKKIIIEVDKDIDVKKWEDVMWEIEKRFDERREVVKI